MEKDKKIKLGISIGDLNGIGSEIIIKTFEDNRMMEFCTPVIFASIKTMSFFKKHFSSAINFHGINQLDQIIDGKINVLNVWKDHVNINFGEEDLKIGEYSVKSLEAAAEALKNGNIDVLVTAPIHKHNIQSERFKFPGHTNYLAEKLGGKSLMFMVTDSLKVGLLTDHVPVKDVPSKITKQLIIEKIDTVYKSLIEDFRVRTPKIAVLGINPHAGDNGVIGEEDDNILRPTLQEIKEKGKMVYGPYSADSFFGSKNYKNFDAIIASYHDQGLIPFKTIAFGHGVNYTAGLSKVRTSPDHGTAFEIAGKGEADHGSFKEAVFKAIEIYNNREEYKEYSKNPLKKAPKRAEKSPR
ncbi:4-hydroxythreonine-4-phosphate dehydrogenase PdxA [Psychroserpens sp. Hel_I_66]|uniref:4-hydroxythreonine-4-phosphate dehydrogenase PdxA n=1 Tax=Psychroserpens sp. Hel_I_66 TaxID=1250004 RepID=UPI000646E792|nr:4-hydroxythreonine-4-phosphate dehydrogenase PdxA [Psychroserpens sp. Hel_I_66]